VIRHRIVAIPLAALLVSAQQSSAPPSPNATRETVFSVTATLVQIDAVVTDSKGRHVTDLTAGDFEVLEDGKPQKITNFSYVRVAAESAPTATAPQPKPLKGRPAEIPPAATPLRPEDVRRTIILMIDDLGLSFESLYPVRRALHKFVDEQMQPGDLVAICRTGAGSGAVQQFTSDKQVLRSSIEHLKWNPFGRRAINVFEPIGMVPEVELIVGSSHAQSGNDAQTAGQAFQETIVSNFTIGTLGAINYVIQALREMPGRKSIVLFSDGINLFQTIDTGGSATPKLEHMETNPLVMDAVRKLIDRANRAGTVIYSLDTRGLQTLTLGAADRPALRERNTGTESQAKLRQLQNDRQQSLWAGQQGLVDLADLTGGFFVGNGNDLNWGLRRVMEDQEGYYLLGYKPPQDTFEEKNGRRKFHKIVVKVTRKSLQVRSRTGFLGATDEETRPRYDTPADQLRAAMLSPFRSAGVHLRLTPLYSEVPGQGQIVRSLLHIDARDLAFRPGSAGIQKVAIDIVVTAIGADDRPLTSIGHAYELPVPPDKMETILRDGLLYPLDVPVEKSGGYQIRAAVRDEATGKIGSAYQYIEVPNLKKGRLALTSVVLDDGEGVAPDAKFLGMTPAKRHFRRGGQVEYLSLLQNGPHGQANVQVDLDAEVRVFRDGKEVFKGPAKLAAAEGSGVWAITGKLRLGDAMAPGEYFLEVVATDRAGKGKNSAVAQWTDFEVVP